MSGYSGEQMIVALVSIVVTAVAVEALKKFVPSLKRKGQWRNRLLWAVAMVAALLVLMLKAWVLGQPLRGPEAWDGIYMAAPLLALEAAGARAAIKATFRKDTTGEPESAS
jgi:hypothetical protein